MAANRGHDDHGVSGPSRRNVHGGEPDLERDLCRDEVDRGERVERGGQKRQAVQHKAGARQSHRFRQRHSSHAQSLPRLPSQRNAEGTAGRGAVVGTSIMLNKLPVELLENVLSCKLDPFHLDCSFALASCGARYVASMRDFDLHAAGADLARGPQEVRSSCSGDEVSSGEDTPSQAGSPVELQRLEHASHRSILAGKGSVRYLAPVQILFRLCAATCRRWSKAVRSPQVLRKLSMARFPLPPAYINPYPAQSFESVSEERGAAAMDASRGRGRPPKRAGLESAVEQAGEELLDARVEAILRLASKAGNDGAQFLLGLYLSRQKTFALLCVTCATASGPAAPSEGQSEQAEQTLAQEARRNHEQLREAVLDTYDEGVELLRSAADLLHPNALYQLGMLAFGGTDVKLRARLFGLEGSGACSDCVLGEEHAELYWRRAAELGHLESRLIVDGDFRLNHLQEMEDRMLSSEAERRSWRLCAGNRLLSAAKRPQSSSSKARECSHEECGMYTLLCEFKQCAGCATSHKKQR